MSDKKKYKIIQPGLEGGKVGETIELTDEQAANRVNKVKLLSDFEKEAKDAKEADAKKDNERDKVANKNNKEKSKGKGDK